MQIIGSVVTDWRLENQLVSHLIGVLSQPQRITSGLIEKKSVVVFMVQESS